MRDAAHQFYVLVVLIVRLDKDHALIVQRGLFVLKDPQRQLYVNLDSTVKED